VARRVLVDRAEVDFTAIRAQGAGGQNVNKVSSAAHLRFDVAASWLQEMVDAATHQPTVRRATKPTYGSKQRRLEGKAVRAEVKAGRGRVRGE
jgi:ribosome-associated protein